MARLKTEIWVKAYIRLVQIGGGFATIRCHGDDDAGIIFLCINGLTGKAGVLTTMTHMNNERAWRVLAAPATQIDDIEAMLMREHKRDPDCWIIDVEDKQFRHFLSEPVDGEWSISDE